MHAGRGKKVRPPRRVSQVRNEGMTDFHPLMFNTIFDVLTQDLDFEYAMLRSFLKFSCHNVGNES